jgi:superfamily II DNA helicase RecQ
MHYEFFLIPVESPDEDSIRLNAFLSSHCIVHVEREFYQRNGSAYWSFCVQWKSNESSIADRRINSKVDYKKILSAEQFDVYSRLRERRKELSEREGIPVYAVATNDQLAEMVKLDTPSLTSLGTIGGFGGVKIERYGNAFLTILGLQDPKSDAQATES